CCVLLCMFLSYICLVIFFVWYKILTLFLFYVMSILLLFFRIVYFMPTITNIVAIAVIWSYLYNTDYGLFNYLLSLINVNEVPWLDDALMAKISLIILAVWKGIGINMIIYLAALQAIPRMY